MQNKDKGDGIEDSPLDMLLVILLDGASKKVVMPSSSCLLLLLLYAFCFPLSSTSSKCSNHQVPPRHASSDPS